MGAYEVHGQTKGKGEGSVELLQDNCFLHGGKSETCEINANHSVTFEEVSCWEVYYIILLCTVSDNGMSLYLLLGLGSREGFHYHC